MAPADGAPLALGQRRQHLIGPLAWRRTATLGTHLKVTPHRHHVAFVSLLQSSQEVRVVAIVGVGHDTAVRHAPGACLIQKRQSNLGFGLECHVSGHPGPFQALRVGCPGFGQIQTHRHRPTRLRITVTARHRHLTVAHLAQCPGVLPRHANRGLTLLGKARVVKDQHPMANRGLGDHLVHALAIEFLFVPRSWW